MFQRHICPPWCKIQVYLLCRSKTCSKQVSKGLKYIKWTTHWAQKSSLTLTFKHVPENQWGSFTYWGTTPAPSLVLIKWRGQKILNGQHLVYRPTDSCKTICPLFQGGHKKCTNLQEVKFKKINMFSTPQFLKMTSKPL